MQDEAKNPLQTSSKPTEELMFYLRRRPNLSYTHKEKRKQGQGRNSQGLARARSGPVS